MSADTLAGLSTDILFDAMAIRLDPARAAGEAMVINWHFTDREEKLTLTLRQTGSELGIPLDRARELEERGLRRLARSTELEQLRRAA